MSLSPQNPDPNCPDCHGSGAVPFDESRPMGLHPCERCCERERCESGCQCQWETGDSPCLIHGEDDGYDVNDYRAYAARLRGVIATSLAENERLRKIESAAREYLAARNASGDAFELWSHREDHPEVAWVALCDGLNTAHSKYMAAIDALRAALAEVKT